MRSRFLIFLAALALLVVLLVVLARSAEAAHCRRGLIWLRHAHECVYRHARVRRSFRVAAHRHGIRTAAVREKDDPALDKPAACPAVSAGPLPFGWPGVWVYSRGFPPVLGWRL